MDAKNPLPMLIFILLISWIKVTFTIKDFLDLIPSLSWKNTYDYEMNYIHSKITMAGDVVPYYTVTALVPTLK